MANLLFKLRGFTPIPFILIALIFADFEGEYLMVGIIFAFLGEVLRIWSIRYAGSETRTRSVGASKLIQNGPYALTRNPLYIANMMLYMGFGIASNAFFPYFPIAILLFFGFQYALIIGLEEQTLKVKFGREFDDYMVSTPRFLPHRFSKRVWAKPNYNFKEAFLSERDTLFGLTAVWVLLTVHFLFE